MPLLDQIRADLLTQLAKKHFGSDLEPAELNVLRDSASSADPPEPAENAPRREVRASFLRWLATDPGVAPHIDSKGLRIYGVTVLEDLNLEKCEVFPVLDICRCDFKGAIKLLLGKTKGISLSESSLGALSAERVSIDGRLALTKVRVSGEICLFGAEIKGEFRCSGTQLEAKGNALAADGAKISGDVYLWEGFTSQGTIRLLGAEIKGDLNCSGAKLTVAAVALYADGARFDGEVFLNDHFSAEGSIRLLGAEIKGNLNCSSATLSGVENPLSANWARISGNVYLNDGFECTGRIELLNATILGNMDCSGAQLTAAKHAILADRAKVGGHIFLNGGFRSVGKLRLDGMKIGGSLYCDDAEIGVLSCVNAWLDGDLVWQSITNPQSARLKLLGATIKNLHDDRESWPAAGNLQLSGLEYEELKLHKRPEVRVGPVAQDVEDYEYPEELPLDAEDRIDWVLRQSAEMSGKPQPWMQLRDLLERKGDHPGAKHVLYSFHRLEAKKRWFLLREWKIVFAWLEEAPQRILISIVFTLLLGTAIFGYAGGRGALAPTETEAYRAFTTGRPFPSAYSMLNPFIYTLDNALPLVTLGQDKQWAPDPRYPSKEWRTNYEFLAWARWILILSGWFQATVLAAAISGRFKE